MPIWKLHTPAIPNLGGPSLLHSCQFEHSEKLGKCVNVVISYWCDAAYVQTDDDETPAGAGSDGYASLGLWNISPEMENGAAYGGNIVRWFVPPFDVAKIKVAVDSFEGPFSWLERWRIRKAVARLNGFDSVSSYMNSAGYGDCVSYASIASGSRVRRYSDSNTFA